MPPPAAKKSVYIAKSKSGPDPWCLICGVNLRLDGRSFVALTSDSAEETRHLFVKVLGIQFQSDYASVNLCSKCDRSLKRINRYSGLESAQKEADALKKSLAENLKSKGQETTEASEADKYEIHNFKGSEKKSQKSDPLIEDEAEDWRDNQELVHEEDDTENVDPNKMPFGLFKKSKKDKKEKKDKKKEKDENKEANNVDEDKRPIVPESEPVAQPLVFKEGTTLAAMAMTVPKKPEPVKEPSRYEEAPDGGFVPAPSNNVVASNDSQISQSPVQEKTDPEKPVDKEETELKKLEVKDGVVKSENSPLINKNGEAKESKLQDQQPGMLCCTIL